MTKALISVTGLDTTGIIARVATKLSGVKKYAEITAMPDLGIDHNCTRMLGGFFTGARYVWDSTVPFVPVVNSLDSAPEFTFTVNFPPCSFTVLSLLSTFSICNL